MEVRGLRWTDFDGWADLYYDRYSEIASNPELGVFLREPRPTRGEEAEIFGRMLRQLIAGRGVALVARIGSRLVGASTVLGTGGHAEDAHVGSLGIFVRAGYRGRGVGDTLLTRALESCSGRFEIVRLAVIAVNRPAIRLYERHGFREHGRIARAFNRGERFFDEIMMSVAIDRTVGHPPARSPVMEERRIPRSGRSKQRQVPESPCPRWTRPEAAAVRHRDHAVQPRNRDDAGDPDETKEGRHGPTRRRGQRGPGLGDPRRVPRRCDSVELPRLDPGVERCNRGRGALDRRPVRGRARMRRSGEADGVGRLSRSRPRRRSRPHPAGPGGGVPGRPSERMGPGETSCSPSPAAPNRGRAVGGPGDVAVAEAASLLRLPVGRRAYEL